MLKRRIGNIKLKIGISGILILAIMIALVVGVVMLEIGLNGMTADSREYPNEKQDDMPENPIARAREMGIPISYGEAHEVEVEKLLGSSKSEDEQFLEVSSENIRDHRGFHVGIKETYKYKLGKNETLYMAPEYYYIVSHDDSKVKLQKYLLKLEGDKAWTLFGLLMFETLLGLMLVAVSMKNSEST